MEKVVSNKRMKYSDGDYELLLELIEKHGKSINKAGNSTKLVCEKKKEWEEILKQFNEKAGLQLTYDQIYKLWGNLKTKSKKMLAKEKMEAMKTGGGNREAGFSTQIEQKVVSLMGDTFKPFDVPDDSDGNYHGTDVVVIKAGSSNQEVEDIGSSEEIFTSTPKNSRHYKKEAKDNDVKQIEHELWKN